MSNRLRFDGRRNCYREGMQTRAVVTAEWAVAETDSSATSGGCQLIPARRVFTMNQRAGVS